MNDQLKHIDISVIKGLIGDDEAIINVFLQKFINTVPADMDEIKKALLTHDYAACKAQVHKLKSSAKAIGAILMADICQNIEDISLQENQDVINNLFNELIVEFDNCKKYIN